MKIKILYLIILLSTLLNAQNAADVDLVLGSGYKSFNHVSVIKQQTDGKIVVGGRMSNGPQSMTWDARVARFNSDGSVDTTFEVPPLKNTGVIYDIAIQTDGKILVGGNFSVMNGVTISQIIRLNTDGTKDDSFIPSISGIVRSIALQPDGKIMVATGASAYVNEHTQRYVFRLNPNGSIDPTFDTGVNGFPGGSYYVGKIAIQADGKILAGGTFYTFNGLPQGKLIRFHSDGTKDTSFDIGTGVVSSNTVDEILVQPDGKILMGGGFTVWNGQPTGPLCRLNTDGSLDTTFALGIESTYVPRCVLQEDGKIIAIGHFNVNGSSKGIVRLNSDGSLDSGLENIQAGNAINCLTLQADNKILVGGFFNEFNGVLKNHFTRLNNDGSLDEEFNLNTGLNDKVITIALQSDGKTLLGGSFTSFEGVSQNRIIRVHDDGSKDTSFNIGTGFNNDVFEIAVQSDGKILVGGSFTQFNGLNANAIIRLNSNGTVDQTFNTNAGFNQFVQAIGIQSDGKLIVGGNFTSFNGNPQNYCIRLNSDGTKDDTFVETMAFNNRITHLKIQNDGKIIVGGNFTTFNGQEQKHLIRLNVDGTRDELFEIGSGVSNVGNNDVVRDIEILQNGSIYVTANAGSYNGNSVKMPIRLNSDGTLDTTFVSTAVISGTSRINALAVQQDGKVIIGGTFQSVNGINQSIRRLMRLNPDGTFDDTFDTSDGNPQHFAGLDNGSCSEIVVQPDGKIWLGGSFFAYRNISSFSAIRLVGDVILSLDDHESNQNISFAYPNPVQNTLYINKIFSNIWVYDVLGKVKGYYENTNELDFSNFPKGTYILSMKDENGNFISQKILKK